MSRVDKIIDHTYNSDATEHLEEVVSFENSQGNQVEPYRYSPIHAHCINVRKGRKHRDDDRICSVYRAVSVDWDTPPTQRPPRLWQRLAEEAAPENARYAEAVGRICGAVEETEDAVERGRAGEVQQRWKLNQTVSGLLLNQRCRAHQ